MAVNNPEIRIEPFRFFPKRKNHKKLKSSEFEIIFGKNNADRILLSINKLIDD
ncbi:hypothetical protein ACO02O_04538 [Dirofilaria immitis]